MNHQTRKMTDPVSDSKTEQAQEQRCPECGEDVLAESDTAEKVCTACGLVLDEQRIDRGPEWRAFDSAEKAAKSRVGAPTTQLMHDKGLSTNIQSITSGLSESVCLGGVWKPPRQTAR